MTLATDIQHLRTRALRNLLNHLDGSVTDQWPSIAGSSTTDFSDHVRAELERDRIFGEVPFIVAHSSEVANRNDFVTVELPQPGHPDPPARRQHQGDDQRLPPSRRSHRAA